LLEIFYERVMFFRLVKIKNGQHETLYNFARCGHWCNW